MAWNIHCDGCNKHIPEDAKRAYISLDVEGYGDAEICMDCVNRPDQLLHILRMVRARGKEQAVIAQEYEEE